MLKIMMKLLLSIHFYNTLWWASMCLSTAVIIEGVCGVGACIFTTKLASSMALMVVAPKPAMRVAFCLNSGKFS